MRFVRRSLDIHAARIVMSTRQLGYTHWQRAISRTLYIALTSALYNYTKGSFVEFSHALSLIAALFVF